MDLNADGHADILSGSYSRMEQPMAGLFQVLWGNADGTFKPAEALKGTHDKPLEIPNKGEEEMTLSICTRPFAVDWDSDGDLDLVVGNFAGSFYLFTGEGKGRFAPAPQAMKPGNDALKLKGEHAAHSDPFVIDWDKDGDLDLLSGTAGGGVQWAENTAGAKKPPILKPFTTLIAAPKELLNECRAGDVSVPDGSTRIWVADANGDGKLDVFVGDTINLISPAEGLSEDEFKKRYADWKAEMSALGLEMAAAGEDEAKLAPLYERNSKLHEKRKSVVKDDRTGFVWLYLQK